MVQQMFFTPFSWRTPSSEEHPGPPLVLFTAIIKRERFLDGNFSPENYIIR